MSFTNPQFTNEGKKLQARALAGECTITFTTMGLGDGELTTGSISALVDLINTVKRVNISDLKIINPDQVQIKSVFQNIDLDTGFFWREVGLFAADPDNPDDRTKDILYCYQNAGDLAEYIPSASSQLVDKILNMSVVVADASTVQISFFSESYALKEDLDEQTKKLSQDLDNHKTDAEAHKDLLNNFAKSVNSFAVTENNNIELSEIRNSYAEDNQKYSSVLGGEAYGKGAGLFAYGAKHAEYPGYFDLYAMTNEGEKTELVGKPNGRLTWGGTLEFNKNNGGTISREYAVSMWYNARNYALIQQKSLPEFGYGPLFSLKTNNGSWECGAWNYDADNLIFSFIDDEKYNLALAEDNQGITPTENNTPVMQFLFDKNGQIRSRLDAISDRFFVKSVNGVNADNAGNVTIEAGGMVPDYTTGVTKSLNTNITAEYDGWLLAKNSADDCYVSVTINGFTYSIGGWTDTTENFIRDIFIPIKKGDVYKVTASGLNGSYSASAVFFAMR